MGIVLLKTLFTYSFLVYGSANFNSCVDSYNHHHSHMKNISINLQSLTCYPFIVTLFIT